MATETLTSPISWRCWPPGASCPGCPEDFDGSGVVNVADLLDLLANWG